MSILWGKTGSCQLTVTVSKQGFLGACTFRRDILKCCFRAFVIIYSPICHATKDTCIKTVQRLQSPSWLIKHAVEVATRKIVSSLTSIDQAVLALIFQHNTQLTFALEPGYHPGVLLTPDSNLCQLILCND